MRIAIFIALAAYGFPALAQMTPGEWEFTSTMTSAMLPAPQTSTVTQCITKAEAEDPTRFANRGQPQDCQMTPGARTAGTFEWAIACPKMGMRGTGKARFGASTIESEMYMTMESQGQKMEMRSSSRGRYVGPCKTK